MSQTVHVPLNKIESTYGALLIGGFIGIAFSGIVTAQTFLYFAMYRADPTRLKLLVSFVWTLDLFHTTLVCASIWTYFVLHFGDGDYINFIPRVLPVTVILTACLTFTVHMFFVHRIYRLTKHNLFICVPIAVLAFLRVCSACVSSSGMLTLQTFSGFIEHFGWVFTVGLSLSSTVDVLITTTLCYNLETSRTGSSSLNRVINLLMLYTFENGLITCIGAVMSLIFWLTAPRDLVFFGIHFVISKLYANSLLVALNTRRQIRRGKWSMTSCTSTNALPVLTPINFSGRGNNRNSSMQVPQMGKPVQLQISVAKTVEFEKTEVYADTELEGISSPSTAVQKPEVEDLERSSPKE